MKNYKMLEVVGDGTYGTVWRGVYTETGEKVAIKKLKNKIKSWQECVDMKEVKALSKLKSHQNVIKLKEIIRETNSDVFLIFEFCDTNLYEYLENVKKKRETLSEMRIKEIIYQIANGLAYTHQNGYFHRDLKPENVLLMIGETEEVEVKIADFGLAREVPTYYNNGALTDYVCTRWYRPPECILKSTNYSSAMDIWALGCIMAELYMLSPIFPGNSEFDQLTRVTNILGPPKFNDWPEGYKLTQKLGIKFSNNSGVHLSRLMPSASIQAINLLYEIFTWDPLRRPNCAKVLANSYFDDVKSKGDYSTKLTNNINNTPTDYSHYNNTYYENYLNNFNYKTYKNHNSYIPEINSLNYPNNKSKLSYLAENDLRFNKKEYNNPYNHSKIPPSQNIVPNNIYTNSQYYFNNNKNDLLTYNNSNINSDSNSNNNNFYYDLGPNRSNLNYYNSINSNQHKSDIENQISSIGSGSYSKQQTYFNFPQIFI